ncbi:lipid-binding protein hsp12 [Yamadazyma tenuis]|uniref:12 kDa heat shock protein n=1 Tax=Candida tenuis (strain ATCC 10573 / BCRC 21748 / CBS 615 / JCM 9827 / NBRC 10315 / NRRL Y-1498 / VKM Y-70) TaxID=590646 RepID=G3B9L4_CANTC|nr:uncharacterized protein CANTEDRAFT_115373 [Yamadazyma tenuis ATCC 10573]EGV61921.1 hypothetical protein CANTEDRAFT_115373 [Yamadazyma tenuis ATCC 10573]WEJ93153.1 lipid-binding protein hsp12 [Yamadazyma tenuis]
MSDLGRKNFNDKVSEAVTPESNKSALEKAKEQVTDKVDQFAAKATPDEQKSFGQTVADKAKEGHEDAKAEVSNNQESLADTATAYIDAAKEQVGNAANYISGVVTGATEGAKTGADSTKK